jgi:hypothetical protein
MKLHRGSKWDWAATIAYAAFAAVIVAMVYKAYYP